ncbi:hypothetical protein [Cellulomonas sp.]|uniref:hypothetical protein n=1 Tax=Cellulomonas sp. TaxID=40001 RepID=UPI002D4A549F|nr:hypothetical protein [Cellulomonas sp.]HYQ75682.1 hypothetical protein [Cellulomonas sp.]
MSIDLGRALRDVVDGPTPRDPRALGGPGGLVRLRGRVRRARTRRAVAQASVGGAAAVAIGVGGSAVDWSRLGDRDGRVDGAAPPATATDPRRPVEPSGSALCGADVADLATSAADLALRLGLPGSDGGGELVGRSLGTQVPVWVTAGGPVVLPVRDAEIALVRDGAVVAVAEDAARLVAGDAPSESALAGVAAPTGSGVLRSCPGTDPEGLAGAVPAPGDYTLVAVAALVDGATGEDDAGHVASPAVDVTLLPEEPPLTGDPDLPADYPLADVPLVGDEVQAVITGGVDGWKVTVAVTGTDALQRAATALGVPGLPVTRWELITDEVTLTADEDRRRVQAGSEIAAARAAEAFGAGAAGTGPTEIGGSGTSFSLRLRGYDVEVTEQAGAGGGDTLVYRVTR